MKNSFLGIDASKGYADFVLIDNGHNVLEKTFQLDDTPEGHQVLENEFSGFIERHDLEMVRCGVESTGGYENNWFALLCRLGDKLPVQVARLNPALVKDAAKAGKNTQVTDALSARNIASYLIRYGDQVDYTARDNKYRSFRSLQNHINTLKKQNTQVINELKQLLYSCFPLLQTYCKQGMPTWVLELLIAYPSPKKLSRAKPAKVARIKNIHLDRANELIAKAKESVANRGYGTDAVLVETMAREIKAKNCTEGQLKKLLSEKCKGPEVFLLQTIKGVGDYSASSIMVEIEDIERFASPKKLAGYFGLYPTLKVSGDKKTVSRMSKRGRGSIRATLYMCAKSAVQHDPYLKQVYGRQRARGKSYNEAIGVIMHKLLRIIWGVLKSRKPYDMNIAKAKLNQANQKLELDGNIEQEEVTKRRKQPYDDGAPTSGQAFRKRKAHRTSQSSGAEKKRDLDSAPSGQT